MSLQRNVLLVRSDSSFNDYVLWSSVDALSRFQWIGLLWRKKLICDDS